MTKKNISVRTERFYSAHHTLLRLAKHELEKAEAEEAGWANSQFSAITFSALAIEAICNAVGERVIDNWGDFESCSPIAKVRLICEHLGTGYDASREPWGSFVSLCKTRNLIGHPKAEPIVYEAILTELEHKNMAYANAPESKLEKRMILDNAQKSVATVEKLIKLFCDKLTHEQKFGIEFDMWHLSATLQPDTN